MHPTTPWLIARGGEPGPNPNPNRNPNRNQVGSLPGVGSDKQRKLLALGVETCAQLLALPASTLRDKLGPKVSETLHPNPNPNSSPKPNPNPNPNPQAQAQPCPCPCP